MSTKLTTLIIVHITSIFIFPYLCHVKLNMYARLLCKNISELRLYVLRTSYWWDIRAIYRQYFEILDVNIVNRWFWYPTSNWFLKHTRLILKYSYTAAQHTYSVWHDIDVGKWILIWYVLWSKWSMLLTQINCPQTGVSMSKGPDISSMIHFCQSRGVYHAPGPLAFLGSLWPNHLKQT